MRRRLKKKPISFVKKNLILILGCFVLLSISTIGYSALNQALNISGDIAIRAVKDIRITDLELATSSEGGYEYYNSQYGTDSVTLSAVLPNVGSSITYETEITNKGTADMEVSELNANISSPLVARLSTLATTEYFDCSIEGLEEGDVIASGETKTFRITISRIANSADNNKNVEVVFGIELKESRSFYTDPILAGNDPDLLNNSLTPVVYDETDKVWRVADTKSEWYNYTNQMWANAVILEDGVTKEVGDPIIVPTADSTTTEVKAMYVWIPRYSYTIKSEDGTNYYGKTLSDLGGSTASLETPGAIDIKFVDTLTVETGTAQYTGSTATNWRTHPAFQWDTDNSGSISAGENITGIWVGKFETSSKTTDACYTNSSETNCTSEKVNPYILPNVISLAYQNTYNQFETAKKFSASLSNNTNIDSHMMKNSEWGAVAYLSQSIYGKYGNSIYTRNSKNIYVNRKNITGYSSGGNYYNLANEYDAYTYDTFYATTSVPKTGTGELVTSDYIIINSDEGADFSEDKQSFNCVLDYGCYYSINFDSPNTTALEIEVIKGAIITGSGYSISAGETISYIEANDWGEESITCYEPAEFILKIYDNVEMKEEIVKEKNGIGASTTGTIYGVYDMVGGLEDAVMAYYEWGSPIWGGGQRSNGTIEDYAKFSSKPDVKYYDSYTGTTSSYNESLNPLIACNGGICYGHALSETGNVSKEYTWYNSSLVFVKSAYPWLRRGSNFDSEGSLGIFGVMSSSAMFSVSTFRSVLVKE